MKHGKIFWGTFLLSVGILGLLASLGIYLGFDFSSDLVIPLILILLGLATIVKQNSAKLLIVALGGILSGALVYSIFWDEGDVSNSLFRTKVIINNDDEESVTDTAEYTSDIPYYDLDEMHVKILAAASDMNISGVNTDEFTARIDGSKYEMKFDKEDKNGQLKITHQKGENDNSFKLDKSELNLKLNAEPEYFFLIKGGASSFYLDFEKLKVKNLRAEIAASEIEMRFGNKQKIANVDLDFAASSVDIYIPEDVGCLLNGKTTLVDKDFSGFEKQGDAYVSKNFDSAEKKIYLNFSGALAEVNVEFYAPEE